MKRKLLYLFTLLFSIYSVAQTSDKNTNSNAGGCATPTITNITGPTTICEGENAMLTVTHDGEDIDWYDALSGGNLIGSGNPFETGVLSSTTSFWAESINTATGSQQTGGGRLSPSSNTGTTVVEVTQPWGLSFDVYEDFIINSVEVHLSDVAGDLVVELRDANYNIIESTTVSTPTGNGSTPVVFEVPLGFEVSAGNTYRLVTPFGGPEMIRELVVGGFPYDLGTVGDVTGGTINGSPTTNATTYYFFYNWTFTPIESCSSSRVEEIVNVTAAPSAPIGDTVQNFNNGDTIADLTVSGSNLIWYSDSGATTVIPDTTVLVNGTTYYVSQTENGCESPLLDITVSETASIEDSIFKNFSYYPNPVTTTLTLDNHHLIDNVTIYDILGRVVTNKYITDSVLELDMSYLKTGIYLIKVKSGNSEKTIKIVKK